MQKSAINFIFTVLQHNAAIRVYKNRDRTIFACEGFSYMRLLPIFKLMLAPPLIRSTTLTFSSALFRIIVMLWSFLLLFLGTFVDLTYHNPLLPGSSR